MKFVHIHLETPIELTEETVFLIIEESPSEYYRLTSDFIKLFDNGECNLSFWSNAKSAKPDKFGEIINDYYLFSPNGKKIQPLLYKKIDELFQDSDCILTLNEINTLAATMINDLSFDFPFHLEFDEISLPTLLKSFSVRFVETYESLLDRLICYLNILVALKGIKFVVFFDLKSVLSDQELETLYHHCRNEKICLLLLESGKRRPLLPSERAILITEDLCELLEKGEKL